MTSSARNISFCLSTRTALLEANKHAKEIINFLEFFLVFVSLLHRLMNHQWIELIYANLWQVSLVFLQQAASQICYKNLGKKVQPICWCSVFISFFDLCITMYLRKFMLSMILSHNDITCFLALWLGNFSTISLNQISSFFSLNTFQDSYNNKFQSIQTVFHSLKLNYQVHAWFKICRQILTCSLEGLLLLSKLKSYKWWKMKKNPVDTCTL